MWAKPSKKITTVYIGPSKKGREFIDRSTTAWVRNILTVERACTKLTLNLKLESPLSPGSQERERPTI